MKKGKQYKDLEIRFIELQEEFNNYKKEKSEMFIYKEQIHNVCIFYRTFCGLFNEIKSYQQREWFLLNADKILDNNSIESFNMLIGSVGFESNFNINILNLNNYSNEEYKLIKYILYKFIENNK